MCRRSSFILATLCILVAAPAFAKRAKIDCSKVSMTKLEPGWGKLAPALQKLPPGAKLCGNTGGESVFITSALGRDALEKFYAPLFASLGCKPLTCKMGDFIKRMECACPKGGDAHAGSLLPAPYDQQYQLFYSGS
jgi:hypothetical protein